LKSSSVTPWDLLFLRGHFTELTLPGHLPSRGRLIAVSGRGGNIGALKSRRMAAAARGLGLADMGAAWRCDRIDDDELLMRFVANYPQHIDIFMDKYIP
jgi:hypothetical protein